MNRLHVLSPLALILLMIGASPDARAQEQLGDGAEMPLDVDGPTVGDRLVGKVTGTEVIKADRLDGQVQKEERITIEVPATEPLTRITLTDQGATVRQALLLFERYKRDAMPEIAGVPEEKRNDGPIDVVSTWSPGFLPYRVVFKELVYPDLVTRVIRRGATGGVVTDKGKLDAPDDATRGKLTVDRPVLKGDQLTVTAPATIAGTYTVQGVGYGGAITPEPAFPTSDLSGVQYEIVREGEIKPLFEADPGFVRVSEPGVFPVTYVWPDPAVDTSAVFIEKRFDWGRHAYELELTVSIHNFGDKLLRAHPGLRVAAWQHPNATGGNMFQRPTNIFASSCHTNESLERIEFPSLQEAAIENLQQGRGAQANHWFPTPTAWVAVDTTYFMTAAAPQVPTATGQCNLGFRFFNVERPGAWTQYATYFRRSVLQIPGAAGGCVPSWMREGDGITRCDTQYKRLGLQPNATRAEVDGAWRTLRGRRDADTAGLDAARESLKSRRPATRRYAVYMGPKDVDYLTQTHPLLGDSLDLGLFGFIAKPLHKMLVWFHGGVGSWALAIIFLTVVIKLLLLPLTNKSYRSMQKMQKLKPKLDEIKKATGGDRKAFAAEQMALFKREKVNPLTGCLPMLLQMPVWLGLYQTIYSSVELYRAPMGLWINDLSAPDPTYVLPIVLGLLMFVQTFLTASTGGADGMQAKIFKFGMPIMFAAFMLFLPAGLVLYILVNVTLTIVQNLIIRKRL